MGRPPRVMSRGRVTPGASPPRRAGCRRTLPAWPGKASARTSAPVWGASIMTSWPSTTPANSPTWSMEPGPPPKKTRSPGASAVPGPSFGVRSYWSWATRGSASARHRVGRLHEARAVEADARRLAAPHVGRADLGERPRHRHVACAGSGGQRPRLRVRVRARRRRPVGLGQSQHLGHVGGRVVVGVHGAGQVGPAGRAVGAQEARRRVDGIRRVVGARRHRPARRHRLVVGHEGGRLELHRPFGPRRIGAAVHAGQVRLTVVRLDGADGGEDRPGQTRDRWPPPAGRASAWPVGSGPWPLRRLPEPCPRRRAARRPKPERPSPLPRRPGPPTARRRARPSSVPRRKRRRRNRGGGHGRERSSRGRQEHGKGGFVILGA